MNIKSAFNYTGAKYPILDQLYYHFPDNIEVLYDIFCGGGSVFINSKCPKIIANDIITPLISFYKELQNSKDWESIKNKLNKYILSKDDKEGYYISRNKFNENQDPYHFYTILHSCTNNMIRFNKDMKFNQTWGQRSITPESNEKLLLYWKTLQSKDITFYNNNYLDMLPIILQDNRNKLIYLDSPYEITTARYTSYWNKTMEKELFNFLNVLDSNNIKFIMSNVSHHKGKENPYMDALKKWNIVNINHVYKKVSRTKVNSQEIIVKNF